MSRVDLAERFIRCVRLELLLKASGYRFRSGSLSILPM